MEVGTSNDRNAIVSNLVDHDVQIKVKLRIELVIKCWNLSAPSFHPLGREERQETES